MKTKTQRKSRILKAVHATATDLRSAGFISKRRMREYDALHRPKSLLDEHKEMMAAG